MQAYTNDSAVRTQPKDTGPIGDPSFIGRRPDQLRGEGLRLGDLHLLRSCDLLPLSWREEFPAGVD